MTVRQIIRKGLVFGMIFLLVFVAFVGLPMNVSAAFAGGDGTASDPYQISTLLQLKDMKNDLDANYILVNDIDASDTVNWDSGAGFVPVGTDNNRFTGTLNGNGFIITGLYINRPSTLYIGLFGYTSNCVIKNVALENAQVNGEECVGSLVGESVGGSIANSYATGSVSGGQYTGGLVGFYDGTISNSYTTCSVNGDGDEVGGLAGRNHYSSISNSYASGSVSGDDETGALVGHNSGTISNSYATGSVSGGSGVGGLVGYNSGSSATISNSYTTGSVSGDEDVGGLVGFNPSGSISKSYWDTETSGQSTSAGGTGKTTAQMKHQATFIGWDFTVVGDGTIGNWIMAGYPHLQMEHTTEIADDVDLQLMAVALNADYILINDIDASETSSWNSGAGFEPIGEYIPYQPHPKAFRGSLDGAGYVITDLYINRPSSDRVGLLGYAFIGEIKNVGLENVEIYGDDGVSCLIGSMNQCSVLNCYSTGSVTGNRRTGGLIGATSGDLVWNCYSSCDVTGSETGYATGGLVGYHEEALITHCYATGSVNGGDQVGGLVGKNEDTKIAESYSTGSVSGKDLVGGLVGWSFYSQIWNSYARGSVSGLDEIGGLIGRNGWYAGRIYNCYATGSVSGSSYVGGLVGRFYSGPISNSFWDTETSGTTSSAGGTGKTTSEMKRQATFVNWDFENIWKIVDGKTYPSFRWQLQVALEESQDLITDIEDMNLPKGTENNLVAKLGDAIKLLEKENLNGAINKLNDFIDYANAQRGKKLTEEQADELIGYAEWIIDNI